MEYEYWLEAEIHYKLFRIPTNHGIREEWNKRECGEVWNDTIYCPDSKQGSGLPDLLSEHLNNHWRDIGRKQAYNTLIGR